MSVIYNSFVRGLWGDGLKTDTPTLTLPKILVDIEKCLKISPQPNPLTVYVWGERNATFLREQSLSSYTPITSFSINTMSDQGIQNFTGATDRNYKDNGIVNWGTGIWRHKLECLKTALKTFDAVIWLDWDCHQTKPLPDDFWERLADGPEFQASLRRYRRAQCLWRRRSDRYFLVHGAFLYCRSLPFIERVIHICEERFPTVNEEIPLSWEADQLTGGWKGVDHWKQAGFEPQCYDQRKKRVHLPDPDKVCFLNTGRY